MALLSMDESDDGLGSSIVFNESELKDDDDDDDGADDGADDDEDDDETYNELLSALSL